MSDSELKYNNIQPVNTEDDDEIDLLQLVKELLSHWWIIMLAAFIAGGATFCYSRFLIPAQYESTAAMFILTKETTLTSLDDLQIGSQLTNDYKEVIDSSPVMDGVIIISMLRAICLRVGSGFLMQMVLQDAITLHLQELRQEHALLTDVQWTGTPLTKTVHGQRTELFRQSNSGCSCTEVKCVLRVDGVYLSTIIIVCNKIANIVTFFLENFSVKCRKN